MEHDFADNNINTNITYKDIRKPVPSVTLESTVAKTLHALSQGHFSHLLPELKILLLLLIQPCMTFEKCSHNNKDKKKNLNQVCASSDS